VFGKLHLVTRTIEGWDASWYSPWFPRRQLTWGGHTYKAPHTASWPPAVESLTSTLWHVDSLLPKFWSDHFCCYAGLQIVVGMGPKAIYTIKILTAYDMPVKEKTHLYQAWRNNFVSTLLGRPPVCVLGLLADAVVSILDPKIPSFTVGGGGVS
jgi:hypothetical protein